MWKQPWSLAMVTISYGGLVGEPPLDSVDNMESTALMAPWSSTTAIGGLQWTSWWTIFLIPWTIHTAREGKLEATLVYSNGHGELWWTSWWNTLLTLWTTHPHTQVGKVSWKQPNHCWPHLVTCCI